MKKIFFTGLLIASCGLTIQAEDEWRWGVSLGTGNISYELDEQDVDGGTNNVESDYNPTIFGFDLSNGTHSVSLLKSGAGSEDLDVTSSGTSDWTTNLSERDYDELSVTYLYRLNPSWSIGVGYNKLSNDGKVAESLSTTYPVGWSSLVGAGDPGAYTFSWSQRTSAEADGLTVLATWVKPLASNPKWVFAAKMGFADTKYTNSFSGSNVLSGIPAQLHSEVAAAGYGNANGDGWDWSGSETSDNIAGVFGMTLVYIFDNSSNTISMNFDTRVDDFGALTDSLTDTPRGGYFTAGQETLTGGDTYTDKSIEQTNSKFTVVWRYAIN